MACFVVPAAEAIVTTIAMKVVQSREKKAAAVPAVGETATAERPARISFSKKLKWLNTLLWGGAALLAFEHLWHGEVVPWFPFLTAVSDPESTAEMLHEMATVGVSMAVLVTAVWLGMVAVSALIEKKAQRLPEKASGTEGAK